jgi:hypothetical protein
MRIFKQEEKKRQEEEKQIKGNKGKGEKDDYMTMCKLCWVQYTIKLDTCSHCGKETVTKQVEFYNFRRDIVSSKKK